jgi:hypothetical protein
MKNLMTISFLIFFVLVGCKQKVASTHTSEQVDNINLSNTQFIGSWELKEWTAKLTDGKIVFPYGEDAKGRITYDDIGNMAVQIMRNNRSPFLSEDPLQAQADEVLASYNGFIAYCGNYDVHPDTHQVVHQIKISSFPNWVGQNQIRFYEFREDELILSTDLIGSSRHKLVWKKVKN